MTGAVLLELARAARRAFDTLDRAALPRSIQPFVGWKPERLTHGRARQALVAALAESPLLREAAGVATGSHLWEAAERRAPSKLVELFGAAPSVVALMGRGRWQEALALDAELGFAEAAEARASAEGRREAGHDQQRVSLLRARIDELEASLRAEGERARSERRRADTAQQYAEAMAAQSERLAGRLADTERELAAAREEARRLHTKQRERLARHARQLRAARDERRVDAQRVRETTHELERLAESLRLALDRPVSTPPQDAPDEQPTSPSTDVDAAPTDRASAPLRGSASVRVGRPCVPPKGLAADHPQTITALLGVDGLFVLLDGYNVTLDARGRPGTPLPQQRDWLTAAGAAVAARFGCRVLVVFDGDDGRSVAGSSARGVRVLFTEPDELADDRIVELLEQEPQRPAVVVTSDQELTARCVALGANVVSSGAFLAAIGV